MALYGFRSHVFLTIYTEMVEQVEKMCCRRDSRFCLGMAEYNCCGNAGDEPEAKKKRLSLVKKEKKGNVKKGQQLQPLSASLDHFNTTASAQEIEQSSKGCIPANTSSSTAWAVHVFQVWLEQRNSHANVDEVYPTDLLDKAHPCDVICNCLQRFVSEARKVDGKEYPPKTLYQLLCGLLRHARNVQCDPSNFLDRKDVRFKGCMEHMMLYFVHCMRMELELWYNQLMY